MSMQNGPEPRSIWNAAPGCFLCFVCLFLRGVVRRDLLELDLDALLLHRGAQLVDLALLLGDALVRLRDFVAKLRHEGVGIVAVLLVIELADLGVGFLDVFQLGVGLDGELRHLSGVLRALAHGVHRVVINPEESLDFTCRYCSELSVVESTKYRIIAEGKTYNITYVNPMGYKRNSIKFNCKLEKPK